MLSKLVRALLAVTAALCFSGAAGAALVVTGQLPASYPTWNRISDNPDGAGSYLDSLNDGLPYEVLEIRTPTVGDTLSVSVNGTTQFDSFLALYSSFNPAAPLTSILAADDDSAGYPHAQLVKTGLAANTSYFLVITSYSGTAGSAFPRYGNYALTIGGNFSVVPKGTSTGIGASPNPSTFGQTITLTATVTKASGVASPTGTITFMDGPVTLGSGTLDASAQASLTISSLSIGAHSVTAIYGGEARYAGSTSAPLTIAVNAGSALTLSPGSLNFANQNVGIASAAQSVTLSNTGVSTLTITSIVPSLPVFGVVDNCAATLAAGSSCTFSVRFTPVATGTRVGAITVTTSASASPHSVVVSGTGVTNAAPVCTLSATPATIAAGQSSTLTASCSPSATSFSWSGGSCAGVVASSCTVAPTVATSYSVTGTNSYGSSTASVQVAVNPTLVCNPISTLPAVITVQGAYCLTGHLGTAMTSGYAITINTHNVVLDLSGFKLGGLAAGTGTNATGIYALDRQNITIKNGTVRGFAVGIALAGSSSQAHVIEDIRADQNTLGGIYVDGSGNIVRNNQVLATGGTTTYGANAPAYGIFVLGNGPQVINNAVSNTFARGSETSYGIYFSSVIGGFAVDNRITTADQGIYFNGSTGKYRDNLTFGVSTPFFGGTAIGSNN